MSVVHAFANQPSSDSTVAVMALTHAGYVNNFALTAGHFVEEQSGVALSDPTVFAIGGSNPNASSLTAVVNQESPFGFELSDALVNDFSRANRVDYNQMFGMQHELWPEPNHDRASRNNEGNQKVINQVFTLNGVKNRLCQKQAIKQNSHRTPNKVAFGPVGNRSFHSSIFAGESLDRKNQTK